MGDGIIMLPLLKETARQRETWNGRLGRQLRRLQEELLTLILSSHGEQELTEAGAGREILRREQHGFLVFRNGLREAVHSVEKETSLVVFPAIRRDLLETLCLLTEGFLEFALIVEHLGEPKASFVRLPRAWNRKILAYARDGEIEPACPRVDLGEVLIENGGLRIEANGLLELRFGLVESSHFEKSHAEVLVVIGDGGIELHAKLILTQRVVILILAGLAVSFMFTALTNYLVFAGDQRAAHSVLFWTMGGLGLARWDNIGLAALGAGIILAYGLWNHRRFDAFLAGESAAESLGVPVARMRRTTFLVAALATAILVAVAGVIGFVGLMIPHLGRPLAGSLHRPLIAICALFGAILLLASDLLARTLLPPQELPIGIITSSLGAFFVVTMLMRRRP